MIIIGHPLIPSSPLYHIANIDSIAQTPPNSTVWFHFADLSQLGAYCREQEIPFTVFCENTIQAVLAAGSGARYLLCDPSTAATLQKVVENYLLDAKVLARIDHENEIAALIDQEIDGVVFKEYLR